MLTELHDQPLLTIFSRRNDPFGFQAQLLRINPAAKELVLPGSNHFPMCADPDAVANEIRDWHHSMVA